MSVPSTLNYCATLSLTVAILPRIWCSKFRTCNMSTFTGLLQFHVSFPLLRRRHAKEPPSSRRLGWRHSKIPSRNLCLQHTSFKRSSLAQIRSTARSLSWMSDESVEMRRSCSEEITGCGQNCKCVIDDSTPRQRSIQYLPYPKRHALKAELASCRRHALSCDHHRQHSTANSHRRLKFNVV